MKLMVNDEVYDLAFNRKATVLTNQYVVNGNEMIIVKQEKSEVTYAAKVSDLEKTGGARYTNVVFNPVLGMWRIYGPFNTRDEAVRAAPDTMISVRVVRSEKEGNGWGFTWGTEK